MEVNLPKFHILFRAQGRGMVNKSTSSEWMNRVLEKEREKRGVQHPKSRRISKRLAARCGYTIYVHIYLYENGNEDS